MVEAEERPKSILYYLRARSYEPSGGQFVSFDPAVVSARQPYDYLPDRPASQPDSSQTGSRPNPVYTTVGHPVGGQPGGRPAVRAHPNGPIPIDGDGPIREGAKAGYAQILEGVKELPIGGDLEVRRSQEHEARGGSTHSSQSERLKTKEKVRARLRLIHATEAAASCRLH